MNEYDSLVADQPADTNEYDAVLTQQQDMERTKLRTSLYESLDTLPDNYAKVVDLQGITGLPTPVIERNQAEITRNAKIDEYDRLLQNYPVTRQAMMDPEFAKLAHDIPQELTGMEEVIRSGRLAGGAFLSGLVPRSNAALWGAVQAGGDVLSSAGLEAIGGGLSAKAQLYQDIQNAYAKRLEGDKTGIGPTGQAVLQGFLSAGEVLPGLIGSMTTGGLAPVLSLMGLQTGGQAYAQGKEAGLDTGKALSFAVAQGGWEVATEMFPELRLLGDIKAGAPLWKLFWHQAVQEGWIEQVATIAQDFNEWAYLHPEQPFSEYLKARPEQAYQTLVATATGVGLNTGAGAIVSRLSGLYGSEAKQSVDAEAFKNRVTELTNMAAASKLRERNPQKFEGLVEKMLGENADANVYINARDFTEFFQSQGVDPMAVASQLTGVAEQLPSQLVIPNGDLTIKASEFINRLGATEYAQGLNDIVRAEPEAMSAKEAAEWQKNQADRFQEIAQKITEAHAEDTAFLESIQKVENDLRDQIVATGRFDEATAAKYAKVPAAFATVLAPQLGILPHQVIERYPLLVGASPLVSRGTTLEQPVYHGSPYRFKEFDLSKIGTGEGAQAYGHGIYVAENPDVAGSYQAKLSTSYDSYSEKRLPKNISYKGKTINQMRPAVELSPEEIAVVNVVNEGSIANAIRALDEWLPEEYKTMLPAGEYEKYRQASKLLRDGIVNQNDIKADYGNLYTIDLPDEQIAKMLDWDKPIKEQSDYVKSKIHPITEFWLDEGASIEAVNSWRGEQIYERAYVPANHAGIKGNTRQEVSSNYLLSLGITGIKYFDQASRATLEGTRNFVLFDPSIAKITDINGEPINAQELFQSDHQNAVTQTLYHGTNAPVTRDFRFDVTKAGTTTDEGWLGKGVYFSPHKDVPQAYGKNLIEAEVTLNNPFRFPDDVNPVKFVKEKGGSEAFTKWVKDQGYDGVISEAVLHQTVVFYPEQSISIKSINGEPIEANTLFQGAPTAPTFYSQMQRVLEQKLPNTGTPAQFKEAINAYAKKGEFKQEELEWSGVNEWLDSQKGKVTKEQVLDFLRANEIQVQEKVLKSTSPYNYQGNEWQQAIDRAEAAGDFDEAERINRAWEGLDEETGSTAGQPKFGPTTHPTMSLPGGENYRELLLTLPVRFDQSFPTFEQWLEQEITQEFRNKENEGRNRRVYNLDKSRALAKREQAIDKFRSGHFEEPNILVHIRFNVRTDADGKLVLFIEEVQSDWHQKGRKEGYRGADVPAYYIAYKDGPTLGNSYADPEQAKRDMEELYPGRDDLEIRQGIGDRATRPDSGVPNAPFKTTWPLLAMKRMIRWAAENGFDRIAWTTGEQQAERYDLSKHINSIGYQQRGDLFNVTVWDKEDRQVLQNQSADGQWVVDNLGKEIADKMEKGVGRKEGGITYLENLDLKVGGEGMKGFYDQILPKEVGKYVKKWGGKVGGAALKTDNPGYDVIRQSDGASMATFGTLEAAKRWVDEALTTSTTQYAIRENRGKVEPVHSLDITPAMREAALQGQPLFQEHRGSIHFINDNVDEGAVIHFLENSDLSTFLHESAHYFFEIYRDIASQPNAPEKVVKDMQAMLDFVGIPDLATWNAMTMKERKTAHEKIAEAFEQYLFEGKAPSVGLRGLFQTFGQWLLHVYKSLRGPHYTISPEIRAVFDRMLASEEEIKAVEAMRQYEPLFKSMEAAGLTPEAWREYQNLGHTATQDADSELQARSLKDMKWLTGAHSRALKRLQKEAKAKREALRSQAEDFVYSLPVYAARRYLTHGDITPPHGNQKNRRLAEELAFKPSKLSSKALKEMYGDAVPDLPKGKYGLVAADGVHPDQVAELFGFDSGDGLVKDLIAAGDPEDAINQELDRLMIERYGDITSPAVLSHLADVAVHNEARLRFLATELKALDSLANVKGERGRDIRGRRLTFNVLARAAQDFAERLIGNKKVREAGRSAPYAALETKAGKAAQKAMLKGDIEQAGEHKRAQLLNAHLFKAASAAADEIDTILAYLKKFDSKGTRKALDVDYLDQIDGLLEKYDLRKSISQKEIERRTNLTKWIENQRAQGYDPAIDPKLEAEANRKHYTELTLNEFRGLRDAIKSIEHLGRLKQKLLTAKDKREFEQIRDSAVASLEAHSKGKRPVKLETELPRDKFPRTASQAYAFHRKFADFLLEMDGWEDNGIMRNLFLFPLNERFTYKALEQEKANEALGKLFHELHKRGRLFKPERIDEINGSLSKWGRIHIALNLGTEINRKRVNSAYGWTPQQLDAVLKPLTKEDWDFVQAIWDFLGSYVEQMTALEERVNGVAPKWQQATPVNTAYGTYPGGYFPLNYDPNLSVRAQEHESASEAQAARRAAYSRPMTRQDHLKERSEQEISRPLRLSPSVIFKHVNQVINDLAFREYLLDTDRLLSDRKLQAAIVDNYGMDTFREIEKLLEDIARGDVQTTNVVERAMDYLRAGVVMSTMAFKISIGLLQPFGLAQSVPRVGAKWIGQGTSHWLKDAAHMENTVKWIYSVSPYMRVVRGKSYNREVSEIQSKLLKESWFNEQLDKAAQTVGLDAMPDFRDSYFYLFAKMQMIPDVVTWLGAYEKAMETEKDENGEKISEAHAVLLADQAVKDSQGGGQMHDLAGVQRGNAYLKMFTTFYSYFNVELQRSIEAVKRTNFRKPSSIGRMAVDLMIINAVPAALGTLLYEAIRGKCDGEWDCIMKQAGKDQLSNFLGLFVLARELQFLVTGFDYRAPAGLQFFWELGELSKQIGQWKADRGLFRASMRTAGTLFHLPTGQLTETMLGMHDYFTDKTDNPQVILTGPKANSR